jgi:uncharacterized protein YlbG (UPF0298 family)
MYLFKYKNEIEISHTCKLCLTEIKFTITRKAYEEIERFPLRKEFIHGIPAHKLILYVNKNLEIEKFKIEDIIEKEVSFSQEYTRQVLSDIELSEEEIELYFLTTGRGTVSLAELAFLIDKSKEECQEIAEKFVKKGLYKEIIGATPHYFALPPYAALIRQLKDFKDNFSDIKKNAISQLNQSFLQLEVEAEGAKKLQDFIDFIVDLKQKMLLQIYTQKNEFDTTISDIDKIKMITEFVANLETVVKKSIDNQLLLIKKKKIKEELDRFYKRFNITLKESLNQTINDINEIINSAEKAGENVKRIFTDVSNDFNRVLNQAEEKLADISEGISQSFENLKTTFSTKVIDTFDDILNKILQKLEISEITIKEFWNQAKQVSLFTMRDVWFIKTVEGIKAQIKDEIPKAKMRLLIVAPQLTDININALELCPKHVNIRIATYIDLHHADHVEILKKLNKKTNVDLRLREKQDLWGINKDSEVIMICAISRKGDEITGIAGIGTAAHEHIRIFLPLIEDAWMSASKHINTLRRSIR